MFPAIMSMMGSSGGKSNENPLNQTTGQTTEFGAFNVSSGNTGGIVIWIIAAGVLYLLLRGNK